MNEGKREAARAEGDTNSVTMTTSANAKRLLRYRISVISFKLVNDINSRYDTLYLQPTSHCAECPSVTAGY